MFGKPHASGKAALVIDVDDVSVGVATAELSDGPVSVLSSERKTIANEVRDSAQSAAAILQLFEQTLDAVLKARDAKTPAFENVYVIVHAPWTHFRTAQEQESYPEPRAITKDMIPALAKKACATITDLDTSNILEAGVMQVMLNGYPTGKPIGKHANLLAVTAFQSDINPEIKRGIIDAIGKLIPGRVPTIRSGMRALLTVLHEHIPDIHRYVTLDVRGTATACTVVRKEMITQHEETTEGSATIVRKIANGGVPEEMLTQLRLLATDSCSTDACKAVQDSLAKAEPELAKVYGEMFAKLAQRRRLPNKAMLAAPAELSPWLQNFFSRIDFAQFTATTQPLDVEILTPDHVHDAVMWKTGAPQDTGIAISAGCVNILEQSA
ncbi:MAG: hypothetical protein WA021_04480 [Minisyncoccia bacterium]